VTDPRGFLQIQRRLQPYRPLDERRDDYRLVLEPSDTNVVREQARRCMDCGVPFCHTGCPLGNLIPEWNDLVERDLWHDAIERLHATNNFPEFTGTLCPAPCEEACVLALEKQPVTIKQVELAIIERAFQEGWVQPEPAGFSTGRRVAVVGSGPAGLACAQELARAGHGVTVFERDDEIGGLLRYGIPDFKLEKHWIDRRLEQLEAEGVEFATGVQIGSDLGFDELRAGVDAVVLATGAQHHRDLAIPGRDLDGVHYAMNYLVQQNRRVAGRPIEGPEITAKGKRVIILGGGDTSADCLGNAIREGAVSVHEIAHGPTPPSDRTPMKSWPEWPKVMRSYAAHEEGGERVWQFVTERLEGDGKVERLVGYKVEFPGYEETGRRDPVVVEGSGVELEADLVLLAIGFTGTEDDPLYAQAGVERTERGTVRTDGFATTTPGVFACGDNVRGADLIVTAIADGRQCAAAVHAAVGASVPSG
jgi:glutamate synthase (NADPH/NADH) small chain